MRRPSVSWIVALLVALPAAAESRVRLENVSDSSSRVTVGFADPGRTPATLRAAADGGVELVVDAPSPKLRLRGGSLQTDPAIELMARRALREESAGAAVLVLPSREYARPLAPADGPLVYDDWGGWWGGSVWTGGWYGTVGRTGHVDRRGGSRIGDSGGARAPRIPASGGSFRAHGTIARPRR